MQRLRDFLLRFSSILTHMLIVLSLWCMLESRGLVLGIPFWQLLLALALVLVLDEMLIGKSSSIVLYVLLNVGLAIAASLWLQSLLSLSRESMAARILFTTLELVLFTDVAMTATRAPKRAELIVYFDLSLIFEALFIALSDSPTLTNSSQFELWGILGCILTLTAVASLRIIRSDAKSTVGMAALLAMAALLFWLASLALGELETMSASIVRILGRVLDAVKTFFMRIITAFFNWLSSLFAGEVVYEFDPDGLNQHVNTSVYRDYGDWKWIVLVVGIAVIVAFIVILVKLRGKRWKKRAKVEPQNDEDRSRARGSRLPMVLSGIFSAISFKLRYLRGRDSAAGLFVWMERKARRAGIRRDRCESPHLFTRRLALMYPGLCSGQMEELSMALERQFYSKSEVTLPHSFAKEFRKDFSLKRISRSAPQSQAQ